MQEGSLIPRFGRARRDQTLAVLEGFHAIKHALRFGAEMLELVCTDSAEIDRMTSLLAPDLAEPMRSLRRRVEPAVFAQLVPLAPSTGILGLARRRAGEVAAVLADDRPAPAILLENTRDLGNMGACIRVAAGAAAAGVLTIGGHDPWHPDALRGAAGLHYAVPVCCLRTIAEVDGAGRPLLAVDPAGEPLVPSQLPPRALLAFGSERRGLSEELSARATARVSIPMQRGVSSLNLATSVAAVLFAWRLCANPDSTRPSSRDRSLSARRTLKG